MNIIGKAPAFLAVKRAARIVAATDACVLLLGESGTGKEVLAHAIHADSRRRQSPFVAINCAALPESLAESELFGHRKGAFTGADANQSGKLELADGGTLFLDEVGELSMNVQAKLLRFLESGECQRLGEGQLRKLNVRVIAATNRDLEQQVQQGRFRADLYYRLNVVPMELPPLRARVEDIELLCDALSTQLAAQHQLKTPLYASCALKLMRAYSWPGNVRELRNFCERMLIFFAGKTVQADNLPLEIREHASRQSKRFQLPEGGLILDEVEADLIGQALEKSHGNQSRAARLLGISRDALLYRIKKYALGKA